jgi:hypothetical protein
MSLTEAARCSGCTDGAMLAGCALAALSSSLAERQYSTDSQLLHNNKSLATGLAARLRLRVAFIRAAQAARATVRFAVAAARCG